MNEMQEEKKFTNEENEIEVSVRIWTWNFHELHPTSGHISQFTATSWKLFKVKSSFMSSLLPRLILL